VTPILSEGDVNDQTQESFTQVLSGQTPAAASGTAHPAGTAQDMPSTNLRVTATGAETMPLPDIAVNVDANTQGITPSKAKNSTDAPRDARPGAAKQSTSGGGKRHTHDTVASYVSDTTGAGAQVVTPATSPVESRATSGANASSDPVVTPATSSVESRATSGANASSDPVVSSGPPARTGASQGTADLGDAGGPPAARNGHVTVTDPGIMTAAAASSGSGAVAEETSLIPSLTLPSAATKGFVAPDQVTSTSFSSLADSDRGFNPLAQPESSGRATVSSAKDNASGHRSSTSSSSVVPLNQAAGLTFSQEATDHSAAAAIASSAPDAVHTSAPGASSPSDASKSIGLSTTATAHAFAAPSFTGQGSTLDVSGLSSAISRPVSGGDGTYSVTVAMHPAGLGHVQAVMSLTGSELQVSLTPETDHGHAALAGAVNDLKNELARGGVNVNIDLRHSQSQTSSDDRRPTTSDTQARPTERTATFVTPTSTARDAGQIHLML
jgi:hypothetical protein